METIHPVGGSFGNEFPSICNHCRVMVAWSHMILEKCWFFLHFWKNDPLRKNFQNSVLKGISASPIDMLCSNFMKFGRWEIGKIMSCLPHKKKQKFCLAPSSCYCADRAQNVPGTAPYNVLRFYSNQFTFGGVISKCVNIVTARAKVNPIFGWRLALSQIIRQLKTIISIKYCAVHL